MAIEVATFISELDEAAPLSGDRLQEGDNHLRLIKHVLKSVFPGVGGNGFAEAITVTEDEINFLSGVTSSVQAQLTALLPAKFTVGTRVVFAQATAPTHWAKITTWSNRMLRVVNDSSGGGSGGIHSPILMNIVPSHTHADSFSIAAVADHTHTYLDYSMAVTGTGDHGSGGQGGFRNGVTDPDGGHNHTLSGSVGVNSGADNWEPLYLNTIVCEFTG